MIFGTNIPTSGVKLDLYVTPHGQTVVTARIGDRVLRSIGPRRALLECALSVRFALLQNEGRI